MYFGCFLQDKGFHSRPSLMLRELPHQNQILDRRIWNQFTSLPQRDGEVKPRWISWQCNSFPDKVILFLPFIWCFLCGLLLLQVSSPQLEGKLRAAKGYRFSPFLGLLPFLTKGKPSGKKCVIKKSHHLAQCSPKSWQPGRKKKIRTGREKPSLVMNVLKLESAVQVLYFLRMLMCPPCKYIIEISLEN